MNPSPDPDRGCLFLLIACTLFWVVVGVWVVIG